MNVVLIRCPNCSQLSRDLKTGRCGECLPPFQASGGRPGREASVSREVMTSVRADKGLDLPAVGLPKNLRRVP